MHPADKAFFRHFAAAARALGRSLEDHYALSQREQRDAEGGAGALSDRERRGMTIACRHLKADDRILVMGCGAGAELGFLRRQGFADLTGLEISERLAHEARARHDVPVLVADMRRSGLAERSFDAVLVHRALHHLLHPFVALEEMARLARRHVLVVDEPARSAVKRTLARVLHRPAISPAGVYEYQFATDDVARYMGFNGFEPVLLRRYWETSVAAVDLGGNIMAAPLGNRFVGIFQRLKVSER